MRTLIILLVVILGSAGAFFLLNQNIYDEKQGDAQQTSYDGKISLPIFEDYSVSKTERFRGTPTPVDVGSSPNGKAIETELTERVGTEPNFARHYKVVTWECGNQCTKAAIVNSKNGIIYDIPASVQTGLDYRIDSSLFVINPIDKTLEAIPDVNDIPDWLVTTYYEWTGSRLVPISSYKVVEGGIIYVK